MQSQFPSPVLKMLNDLFLDGRYFSDNSIYHDTAISRLSKKGLIKLLSLDEKRELVSELIRCDNDPESLISRSEILEECMMHLSRYIKSESKEDAEDLLNSLEKRTMQVYLAKIEAYFDNKEECGAYEELELGFDVSNHLKFA